MSQVFVSPDPDSDAEMWQANEQARAMFRFFLREVIWEDHRIVPGLGLACIKVPFCDPPSAKKTKGDHPEVEQMWISEISFDGKIVKGTLLNSPNWLTSVKEGDDVTVPISGISDWMYLLDDRVYGAYTVNLLRKRMGRGERSQHDQAWGLDFGDPSVIHVVPPMYSGQEASKVGFLGRLLGQKPKNDPIDPDSCDHPMAINMGDSLRDHLKKNPGAATEGNDEGWTLLHDMTSAGSQGAVSILLKHGANPNAAAKNGVTPIQIAKALGWKKIAKRLASVE